MAAIKCMALLPKSIYKFNTIPFKVPADFLIEIDKLILKFMCKCKGSRKGKTIMKKEQRWRSYIS